jgi:hypothetical protein
VQPVGVVHTPCCVFLDVDYRDQTRALNSPGVFMGQVHVRVLLTNYREALLARLGQLDTNQVHRYETEALIDTGAVRSAFSTLS